MAVRKIARVKVDRECIDKGVPGYTGGCPVWLALMSMVKEDRRIEVGYKYLTFYVPTEPAPTPKKCYLQRVLPLPREARDFVEGFDYEGKAMLGYLDEPFEFVLDDFTLRDVFKPEYLEEKRF